MQHGIDSARGGETNNSSKTYLSFDKGTELSSEGTLGRLDPREADTTAPGLYRIGCPSPLVLWDFHPLAVGSPSRASLPLLLLLGWVHRYQRYSWEAANSLVHLTPSLPVSGS